MLGNHISTKKNQKTTVPKQHVIAGWILSAWQHIKEETVQATWRHIAKAPAKAEKANHDENKAAAVGHGASQSELAIEANREDTMLAQDNFLNQPMSAKEQDLFEFLI